MQWKQVSELEEFSGYKYNVSENGKVQNSETGKILAQHKNNGYFNVNLNKSGVGKWIATSRLVAKLYVNNPNPEKNIIVNHIDGNKLNNHYSNLEWTTQKENVAHANENGLVTYHKTPVIKLDRNDNEIERFDTIEEGAKSINLTKDSIYKVLRGKNQTAGGFKWKYVNEKDKPNELTSEEKKIAKNIIGYKHYQILPNGKVYSKRFKKFMVNVPNDKGYTYVSLCKDGEKKNTYIHTIVAKHFIDETYQDDDYSIEAIVVNHIDGNKSNNHIDNLEIITQAENNIHANQFKKGKISNTKFFKAT